MDPVINLREQLDLAHTIVGDIDSKTAANGDLPNEDAQKIADDANRLAELVLALDEWIRAGGFPPYEPKQSDLFGFCKAWIDGYIEENEILCSDEKRSDEIDRMHDHMCKAVDAFMADIDITP